MELERTDNLTALPFLRHAGVLGAKLGFIASALYSLGFALLVSSLFAWFVIYDWFSASVSLPDMNVSTPVIVGFCVLIMACAVAVLPSTIIGAITATLTATPLFVLRQHLSMQGATVWGIGVALFVTIVVHLVAASSFRELDAYLQFLGVPSIFYIATSGYGSRRLFQRLFESRHQVA